VPGGDARGARSYRARGSELPREGLGDAGEADRVLPVEVGRRCPRTAHRRDGTKPARPRHISMIAKAPILGFFGWKRPAPAPRSSNSSIRPR